ncbi:hypothetical protein I317_07182 [Kwoniella heveanensis CBS 569]|nr:hypothetical protein I317_07182 [Kwoniella heveanensis CBS 569]
MTVSVFDSNGDEIVSQKLGASSFWATTASSWVSPAQARSCASDYGTIAPPPSPAPESEQCASSYAGSTTGTPT